MPAELPDDFPEDSFTPLQANSSGLHEVFESHMAAGFSDSQALFLLAAQLGANIVVP